MKNILMNILRRTAMLLIGYPFSILILAVVAVVTVVVIVIVIVAGIVILPFYIMLFDLYSDLDNDRLYLSWKETTVV